MNLTAPGRTPGKQKEEETQMKVRELTRQEREAIAEEVRALLAAEAATPPTNNSKANGGKP